jgi:hypothetical protein
MLFGPCNALATFQRMINNLLRDFLHKFVTVYLDDVCVYSRTLEEHLEHLRLVRQPFKEEGLTLYILKKWSTWATLCLIVKCPFRQRKSRLLHTDHYLRRIRRFAVSCNSETSTPSSFITLATLRLH